MTISKATAFRFSVAASQSRGAAQAGQALGQAAKNGLGERTADLACLFFSRHYVDQAEQLFTAVRSALGPQLLVGCTGEGIITDAEEIENAPGATLWAAHLPGVHLTPFRLSFGQDGDRFSATGWPDPLGGEAGPPVFLLMADPFSTPVDEVLLQIGDLFPGSIAIGGLAGGGQDLGGNRMLLNDEVYDEGLVGVALSGPICIRTIISQGCRPIGERYVITKAENNVIYELGGSPALEHLQATFESLSSDEQNLAHRALHLGVLIDEHRNRFERGDFLVRNLIGADRSSGSVAIGDMVREGQTVQFHLRDAKSASEDLHSLLAAYRSSHKQPPLGALLFSCCGRGRGLFGRPHHDTTALREHVGDIPVAGFFAQGEIGPVGGSNFLHGYTASIALFSEPES
ncbi:MAG TPA: FIST N-terminal domain-containing protein [Nitrospiraceae bacterium]|nr:FIST N-terminal domain-containing protein [Nitrospiraceae bacterium]